MDILTALALQQKDCTLQLFSFLGPRDIGRLMKVNKTMWSFVLTYLKLNWLRWSGKICFICAQPMRKVAQPANLELTLLHFHCSNDHGNFQCHYSCYNLWGN